MRQQHARRSDIHNSDSLFGGNRFEEIASLRSTRRYARTFTTRIARIQNINRNIFLYRGQNRCRVQYLCAKVSQLRSLIEADGLDPPRIRTKIWISSHHPIHIGPNLYAFGVKPSADNRRREIASAASNRGCDSSLGCADKPAHYWYAIGIE